MVRMMLAALLVAGAAQAEDWVKVSDEAGVLAALDDRKVDYANASQIFYRSGRTLYDAGRPSWGNWQPRGAQYCSEWPPNGGWACYDLFVSADGTKIRFLGSGGADVTDGVYADWQPAD